VEGFAFHGDGRDGGTIMKTNLKIHKVLLGLLASAATATFVASAMAANVHGSICQTSDFFDATEDNGGNTGGSGRAVDTFGAFNEDSDENLPLFCPIPTPQNVGASQQFNVFVEDGNNDDDVSCFGVVLNELGDTLCTTASDSTTPNSFTGDDTLAMSCNAGTASDQYSYIVQCDVPEDDTLGASGVQAIRVF
jgi:hypothetical protein